MPEITAPSLNEVVHTDTLEGKIFFIDDATGDDSDDGLSSGTAFKTFFPFVQLLPRGIRHLIRAKTGPGTYTWTPIPAKALDQFISIEADEARAGIFTELVASQAADAGTTSSLIKFIGNVTDFGGKMIEMLSGAATGERRDIQSNILDPEDIIPVRPITGVVPTDTFRIFESNVILQPPDPDGSDVGKKFGWFGGDLLPTTGGTALPVPGGIALLFVKLDNSATFSVHTFGPGFYYLYGVEMLNASDRFVWHGDAIVQSGFTGSRVPLEDIIAGLDSAKWQGCAVRNQDLNGPFMDSPNGRLEGYVRCAARLNPGEGTSFLLGGYTTLAQPSQDGGLLDIFAVPGLGLFFCDAGAFNTPAAKSQRSGRLRCRLFVTMRKGTGAANLLESIEGGDVLIDSLVTGEHPDLPGAVRSVFVDSDSRLFCAGAPAFGHASELDWEVVGAAAFNKSTLAGVGSKVFFDGSIASRIS